MLKSVFSFGSPIRLPSTWYEEPTGAPPPNPAPAGDGKGAADGKTDQPPPEEKQYTAAELEAAKKAVADAEKKKAADKLAADKKAADEKALADKEEWKTLAANRADEITTLKASLAEYETLREGINAMIAAEIEKWPAEVKDLDPGVDNVAARLTWATKGRALVAKLAGTTQAPPPPAPNTQQGKKPPTAGSGVQPNTQAGNQSGAQATNYRFQGQNDVRW